MPSSGTKRKLLMLSYNTLLSPSSCDDLSTTLPTVSLLLKAIKDACNAVDEISLCILLGMLDIKVDGPRLSPDDRLHTRHDNELMKPLVDATMYHRWTAVKVLIRGSPNDEFTYKALKITKMAFLGENIWRHSSEAAELLNWCSKYRGYGTWSLNLHTRRFPPARRAAD